MSAHVGGSAMRDAGIFRPTDLLSFPWEDNRKNLPTDEEVEEMQNEIDFLNKNGNVFK